MTFLANLWGRVSGWLLAAGGLIAIGVSLWLKGRQEGKALMREEQERHRREAITLRKKLDSEVEDLGHADLDHRFSKWVREDGR